MNVALVGATPLLDALRELLGAQCTLATGRTTADHVAQVAEAAVLDLPAGESREFVRALGALNLRVLDLGPDLRGPLISCALLDVSGKRVAAMPSAGAAAAWTAIGPLLAADVMHAGRLAVLAEAADFEWLLAQAGIGAARLLVAPPGPQRATATVVGEIGAHQVDSLAFGPDVRRCGPGIQPDLSRVQGSAAVEVSVRVDEFSELVVATCALDPVPFLAQAALRALRQMAA